MSEDYNHELRARALALPEAELRDALNRDAGEEDR